MFFTARKSHNLHELHYFLVENVKNTDIQSVAGVPDESTTAQKFWHICLVSCTPGNNFFCY